MIKDMETNNDDQQLSNYEENNTYIFTLFTFFNCVTKLQK